MLIRDIKKTFYDRATHQRIRQHILNINDTITDEDLKNIKTNWNISQGIPSKEIEYKKVELLNQ
jgi:hypothetical protein